VIEIEVELRNSRDDLTEEGSGKLVENLENLDEIKNQDGIC